jgi:hypothetical protein
MVQCDKVGAQSVAIPALGTGIFQFPVAECAKIIVNEMGRYLRSKITISINVVRIVLIDEDMAREFDKASRQASSLTQAAVGGQGGTPVSFAKYQWKFCNDSGIFQAYDKAVNQDLENAYSLNGGRKIDLNMNGFSYETDFTNMTQTNLETRKQRTIRREFVSSESQNDAQWYYQDDCGRFCCYDTLSGSHLEAAHTSGKSKVTLKINQLLHEELDLPK